MYGLKVYNQNRVLQIDGEYKNLFLINKVDASVQSTATSAGKDWNTNLYRYTKIHKDSIIALRSNTENAWIYMYQEVDGYPNNIRIQSIGIDGTANFTIFEFGTLNEATTYNGKFGLRVYSSITKEVIFDSRKCPMRVVKNFYYPSGDSTANTESLAYNSNYAMAVCEGSTSYKVGGGPVGGPGGFVFFAEAMTGAIKKNNSSEVSIGRIVSHNSTFNGPSNTGVGGTTAVVYGFIVDVTNY